MTIYVVAQSDGKTNRNSQRYLDLLSEQSLEHVSIGHVDARWLASLTARDIVINPFVHRNSDMQMAAMFMPAMEVGDDAPLLFPNNATRWHFDDKFAQYLLLGRAGFPIPETAAFFSPQQALAWAEQAQWPQVFKLKGGAGASNVILVRGKVQATNLIEGLFSPQGMNSERMAGGGLKSARYLFGLYRLRQLIAKLRGRINQSDVNPYWQRHKDYVLFQAFMPENNFDTRITIIGDRAFAFRRHNRKDDFRASGSGNVDYDQSAIDPRCVEIAFQVSRHFGFQAMAYDFLFDPNQQPVIGEISYTFVATAVYDCPGYFCQNGEFISGHFWPQACIIEDLLSSRN